MFYHLPNKSNHLLQQVADNVASQTSVACPIIMCPSLDCYRTAFIQVADNNEIFSLSVEELLNSFFRFRKYPENDPKAISFMCKGGDSLRISGPVYSINSTTKERLYTNYPNFTLTLDWLYTIASINNYLCCVFNCTNVIRRPQKKPINCQQYLLVPLRQDELLTCLENSGRSFRNNTINAVKRLVERLEKSTNLKLVTNEKAFLFDAERQTVLIDVSRHNIPPFHCTSCSKATKFAFTGFAHTNTLQALNLQKEHRKPLLPIDIVNKLKMVNDITPLPLFISYNLFELDVLWKMNREQYHKNNSKFKVKPSLPNYGSDVPTKSTFSVHAVYSIENNTEEKVEEYIQTMTNENQTIKTILPLRLDENNVIILSQRSLTTSFPANQEHSRLLADFLANTIPLNPKYKNHVIVVDQNKLTHQEIEEILPLIESSNNLLHLSNNDVTQFFDSPMDTTPFLLESHYYTTNNHQPQSYNANTLQQQPQMMYENEMSIQQNTQNQMYENISNDDKDFAEL